MNHRNRRDDEWGRPDSPLTEEYETVFDLRIRDVLAQSKAKTNTNTVLTTPPPCPAENGLPKTQLVMP